MTAADRAVAAVVFGTAFGAVLVPVALTAPGAPKAPPQPVARAAVLAPYWPQPVPQRPRLVAPAPSAPVLLWKAPATAAATHVTDGPVETPAGGTCASPQSVGALPVKAASRPEPAPTPTYGAGPSVTPSPTPEPTPMATPSPSTEPSPSPTPTPTCLKPGKGCHPEGHQ